MGALRAQQIAIVTGSLLALSVCVALVPPMGLRGRWPLLGLGLILSVFMAGFDMVIARFAMRRPWRLVLRDFDPRQGNLLVFGLAFLLFAPWLAVGLRS